MEWLGFAIAPLWFAGFCARALSMDRHHREVAGGPCPASLRRRLRRLSLGLFVLAAAIAVAGRGIGIVAGVLSAAAAAGAVVGILSLRPHLLARLLPSRSWRSAKPTR